MIFALKVLFFGLAVALIPIASVLYDRSRARLRTSAELQSLIRISRDPADRSGVAGRQLLLRFGTIQ